MLDTSSDGSSGASLRKRSVFGRNRAGATAKQEWSSDRSGGAGEAKSVFGRSEPSETAELRWPSGHATEQNRETWRRSSEQHGCSEPPKPEGAGQPSGKPSGSKSGDRGVGCKTGSPIALWGKADARRPRRGGGNGRDSRPHARRRARSGSSIASQARRRRRQAASCTTPCDPSARVDGHARARRRSRDIAPREPLGRRC
jgi:hypothetical protein